MIGRENRFRGSRSVRLAYRGKQARGKLLSLHYSKRSKQGYRVVVVVSKRVSKSAVVRNRIRRRLYELFRTQFSRVVEGYDCIVSVYDASLATEPSAKVGGELRRVLSKATLVGPSQEKRAIVEKEGK